MGSYMTKDQNRPARIGGDRVERLPGGRGCYRRQREERNDLQESKVHRVSRYLDGLKLQIRDRIGVHVVKSVAKAKNLVIKVEGTERKEDKGPGKKVAESKEGQKAATNPYAKPILGKRFCCGQPGHRLNECPTRKHVNVVEREEEEPERDHDVKHLLHSCASQRVRIIASFHSWTFARLLI
ncbi:hypothetical protein M9H77_34065 [Catharanthus roseus]|uniref:Uncharacterized protein n=1 Tax=Catharanthus roseus TaxID=4058 RepID=A0ACB9ZKV3_CATRO|nr:hypothetical protein M9H77_34065 [Catharanthus roseus]